MAEESDDNTKLLKKLKPKAALSTKHFWWCFGLLPLWILVFVAGVISLASAFKMTTELLAIKPENRSELFARKINATTKQVEEDYEALLLQMEDPRIDKVNTNFGVLYDVSWQSEQDYSAFVDLFKKAVYQVASKTKGSGEWYFYYDRDLDRLITNVEKRRSDLEAYLNKGQ